MTAIGATALRAAMGKIIAGTVADQQEHRLDTYAAVRPQDVRIVWEPGVRLVLDCSDYCRVVHYSAGCPDDPAGNGYQPYGNSSSIWLHLREAEVSLAEVAAYGGWDPAWGKVEVGDIFTFGRWTGEQHACVVYQAGRNPTVGNMGGPGQPGFSTLLAEASDHSGYATLCKPHLPPDPPPTPQDRLRARTGFYAWVAWRLGEGPWRHYGKLNKTVRPNVPRVIPPGWWTRLARFLANRKKGNQA